MPIWTVMLLIALATDPEAKWEGDSETTDVESAPRPATNPGAWIQSNDYPPSSLRNEEEGRVDFTLDVDENGRVSGCVIDESSQFPALDEATCRVLSRRAHFIPAQNQNGEKIAGRYSSSVRWEIPLGADDVYWIMPHTLDVTLTIDSDGAVIGCEIHQLEPNPTEPQDGDPSDNASHCEYMIASGRMMIFPDDTGNFPQRYRVQSSVLPETDE